MKKTKHTPEEWRFIPETDHNCAEVTTSDARQIAVIYGDGRVQREQRGRLIAAAPELLKALCYVLDNHHEGEGEFNNIVRNAIAKAEGRQP